MCSPLAVQDVSILVSNKGERGDGMQLRLVGQEAMEFNYYCFLYLMVRDILYLTGIFVLQMHRLAEAGACAGSRQLPVSGIRANPGSWNPDMMFTCINKKNSISRILKIPNQNQDANQEVRVNPVIEHVVHVGLSPTGQARLLLTRTCDPSRTLVCMQPVVSRQSTIK